MSEDVEEFLSLDVVLFDPHMIVFALGSYFIIINHFDRQNKLIAYPMYYPF